ncbi:MAG TPA: hypothetical protein VIL04_06695 [Solirubrobacterales bacterium]
MTAELSFPLAHHALITAVPFFAPALLIVGGLLVLRLRERTRDHSGDE